MPFKSAMAILANSSLAEAYGVESCPKEPLAAFEKAKNFSRCPCDLNVFKEKCEPDCLFYKNRPRVTPILTWDGRGNLKVASATPFFGS
ncbi:hypothetical protein EB796_007472 [Bugula neritina]|uniref:Uncharacterized protein n=1 Tax=Bugula neritina TaxID=10212 RepID=A0A7J7K6I4_BUGNE|nr:hypothetical protein EB796_007472 [Bugula neritina]